MVQEAVQESRSQAWIGVYRSPGSVGLVGRAKDSGAPIAASDTLKEAVSRALVRRAVAHLIPTKSGRATEGLPTSVETVSAAISCPGLDPIRPGQKRHRHALPDSADTQGDGQMGLAKAGRAEPQAILGVLSEAQGSQGADLARIAGGLKREGPFGQVFWEREAGLAHLALNSALGTSSQFSLGQGGVAMEG